MYAGIAIPVNIAIPTMKTFREESRSTYFRFERPTATI